MQRQHIICYVFRISGAIFFMISTNVSNTHCPHLMGRMLGAAAILIAVAHVVPADAANLSVTIQASPKLLSSPVAQTAIDDTKALLQQAMPSADVSINKAKARVVIVLPDTNVSTNRPNHSPPNHPPHSSTKHRLPTPDRSYRWKSSSEAGQTILRLHAGSPEGMACGLFMNLWDVSRTLGVGSLLFR
jgi:hypothetical protein